MSSSTTTSVATTIARTRDSAWFTAQRRLLRACTPESVADEWLDDYDHQNALQEQYGEDPLYATEFVRCRVEDLMMKRPTGFQE